MRDIAEEGIRVCEIYLQKVSGYVRDIWRRYQGM